VNRIVHENKKGLNEDKEGNYGNDCENENDYGCLQLKWKDNLNLEENIVVDNLMNSVHSSLYHKL